MRRDMWTFEMLLNESRKTFAMGNGHGRVGGSNGPSDQVADFQDRTEPHTEAQRFGFQSWG